MDKHSHRRQVWRNGIGGAAALLALALIVAPVPARFQPIAGALLVQAKAETGDVSFISPPAGLPGGEAVRFYSDCDTAAGGGHYRATFGPASLVFRLAQTAASGEVPLMARLIHL